MATRIDLRRKALQEMVGKKVTVKQLGPNELSPSKIGYLRLYVPLPEYGISLWLDEEDREPKKASPASLG